ncbi:hypothetical protein [Aquimarina sp. AU474]|uniref:hypothetical protein n=1 Tax=Aquimarina sp. AU474 TaxID=2108529 RepID=UPI000D690953|nr:hypothetical protein [Aquimarina sp. AU474]
MKTLKILFIIVVLGNTTSMFAQSEVSKSKENSSKETVTKIIRIKGPNGEEKVIKKQEVITKKSEIKLNPGDEDKTNQSASYTDQEVQVQKSQSSSDTDRYSKISDGKGYVMTFFKKSGNKTSKVRSLNNGFYIVNFGGNNNSIGHFDTDKNFIVESYDSNSDQVITTIYRAN